jgi:hypothetical protein
VSVIVAKSKGRWCARLLNPRAAGTAWLELDGDDPIAALAAAAFVFEGKAHTFEVLDVTDWHASTREGIETARTLDELIEPPSWIRAAVLAGIREERARR